MSRNYYYYFINLYCWNEVLIDGPVFFQILNLTQALKDGKSPVQLVQMPVVVVERSKNTYGKGRPRTQSETFTQRFGKRAPFFSWC